MLLKKNIASLVKKSIPKSYNGENIIFNYPKEWEILDK